MIDKSITITKVVTRNFIMDIVANLQNMLGLNLTSYEQMIDKGMKQIKDEIILKRYKFYWYRYEITQLSNGAASITFYGDLK